jgi:hypothetical protein
MMDGGFIPSVFVASPGGSSAYNAAFLNAPLVTIDDWADMVIAKLKPRTAIVMIHPVDTEEGGKVAGSTAVVKVVAPKAK